MEMEKKNIAIIILAVVLGVSGVGNIILGVMYTAPAPSVKNTIIASDMYAPDNFDVHELWESAGFQVTMQIYEPLWRYDLSNPNLPLVPQLAKKFGTWEFASVDPINSQASLTVPLREDVYFHDGTKFNAAAVKWNFDRLAYFMNVDGTLAADVSTCQFDVLYKWPDGTPVINKTVVVDTYTIKFVLNKPFGPFEAIMTFNGGWMMAPDPILKTTRIVPAQVVAPGEDGHAIVGTGPFEFESYTSGIETRMKRNDNYWKSPSAIEHLIISVITDADARNNAMLAGDVDVDTSPEAPFYDEMRSSDAVNLVEIAAPASSITTYLGFNNKKISKPWRQAISWAIDYDYMIDELKEGEALRLESPIPMGIEYANYESTEATLDLTKARQIMVDNGLGGNMAWSDQDWKDADLRTLTYTYNVGNKFREDFLILLQANLDLIGITVTDNGKEWTPYLDLVYNRTAPGYDGLDMWFLGWIPDYNDASNYVNSLMSNVSSGNACQINDPILEPLLRAGLSETDSEKRKIIYDEMQTYLVEDLMPWAWGYSLKTKYAFAPNLRGFPTNPWGYDYYYPMYWVE